MKRIVPFLVSLVFFTLLPAVMLFADNPAPPPPGGDPANTGGVPVGAPIDDGMFILLALGLGYGLFKLYEIRKKNKEHKDFA